MLLFQEIKAHIKRFCEFFTADQTILVFMLMSHGGPGYIEGTDGDLVYIDDDIIAPFDGDHLPELRGKPKVFFFQACRGARE